MTPVFLNSGSSGENGAHATESILRCVQQWAYEEAAHEAGANDALLDPTGPLARGILLHAGLAQVYARQYARQQGESANIFGDPLAAVTRANREIKAPPAFVARVMEAVAVGEARAAAMKDEILAVEEIYSMKIGTADVHTQRADVVVRSAADRKIRIIDHKGVGRLDAQKLATRYKMSAQFIGYRRLGRLHFGEEFGGAVVDAYGFGDAGSSGAIAFAQIPIPPALVALSSFEASVLHARELRRHYREAKVPIDQHPKAMSETVCITPYGTCRHYLRCTGGI